MLRHHWMTLLMALFATAGCERAHRYPLPTADKPDLSPATPLETKPRPIPPQYGWLQSYPQRDLAIQFVAEDTRPKEWQILKEYWTGWPAPVLQLSPWEAAATLSAQLRLETIQIKVPRGLPDPTPFIPAVNPPTLGKWALGKRLFFDDKLLKVSLTQTMSCASCHVPAQAFALDSPRTPGGVRNVPTLLNCAYNRLQFWDGRVVALEEVLWRQLEEERDLTENPPPDKRPAVLHVWPGMVERVRTRGDYDEAFQRVFGTYPTADNIAKALATYLRTLLSGNSLVDRANHQMKKRGAKDLETRDFEQLLSGDALKILTGSLTAKEVANELSRGHNLFYGRARCHVCHSGPLLTDHGFHNVGVGDSIGVALPGKEPGRFAVVPYGLKEPRLIGAYKTPSLRDVSRTGPYMHDGSFGSLVGVLQYFNDGIRVELNDYLDPELTEGANQPRTLLMDASDLTALELYLRALRGDELPAFVTGAK